MKGAHFRNKMSYLRKFGDELGEKLIGHFADSFRDGIKLDQQKLNESTIKTNHQMKQEVIQLNPAPTPAPAVSRDLKISSAIIGILL